MEAHEKNERQDETQFTTKIDGFLSFTPPWMVIYSHPVYDQTQGTGAVFSWLYGYLYCGRMIDFWRWHLTFIKVTWPQMPFNHTVFQALLSEVQKFYTFMCNSPMSKPFWFFIFSIPNLLSVHHCTSMIAIKEHICWVRHTFHALTFR